MMNKVYLEGQLAFSCCSGGTVAVPSALFRFISMTVGGGGLFGGHSTCTCRFGLKPVINLSG